MTKRKGQKMISILLLVSELSGQVMQPCTKFNPCYFRADGPIEVRAVDAGTDMTQGHTVTIVTNQENTKDLLTCQKALHDLNAVHDRTVIGAEATFVLGILLVVVALAIVVGARRDLLAAITRAEIRVPLSIRRLIYVLVTPMMGLMLGAAFVRGGSRVESCALAAAPREVKHD